MQRPEKGSVRAAAWFATVLCGITLVLLLIPLMATNPPVAFYSFLPVVFFMIAHQHEKAEKTIRELRERVEALEATRQPERDPPQHSK
jgi:4-hydroxybenzoate polyprenyltransferase